jgi:hypothetical protein
MFTTGQSYARREIHDAVGGDLQSYLPSVEGTIVAACLTRDTNPGAPFVILPGKGLRIQRAAEILCQQRTPVPTFIKLDKNRWKYRGVLGAAFLEGRACAWPRPKPIPERKDAVMTQEYAVHHNHLDVELTEECCRSTW